MNGEPAMDAASAIFAERARKLAARVERTDDAEAVAHVTVVAVGSERFGLPIETLREVVPLPPVCRLPGLPAYYPGMVQVRGEIIAVLDLARLYGIPVDAERRLLAVVDDGARVLGLLVDAVVGSEEIARQRLAGEFDATHESRHTRLVTRDLITVLDIRRLLADERLVVGGSPHGG